MGADEIRRAIEAARGYLQQHPEDAKSTDSSASAALVDGLVVRVSGPCGESITTDMVPSVGGTATAPSPGRPMKLKQANVASPGPIQITALDAQGFSGLRAIAGAGFRDQIFASVRQSAERRGALWLGH